MFNINFKLLAHLKVTEWSFDPVANQITWRKSLDVDSDEISEPLQTVLDRYTKNDSIQLLRHIELALKDGFAGPERFGFPISSGKVGYIESVAIRTVENNKVHIRGLLRNCRNDVTNEKTIMNLGGILNQVIENVPSAILIADKTGKIRTINKNFGAMFNVTNGILGERVHQTREQVGPTVSAVIGECLTGERAMSGTRNFQLSNGQTERASFKAFCWRIEGEIAGAVLSVDYSPTQSKFDFDALFDLTPIPIIVFNERCSLIEDANEAACMLLDLSRSKLRQGPQRNLIVDQESIEGILTITRSYKASRDLECAIQLPDHNRPQYIVRCAKLSLSGRVFVVMYLLNKVEERELPVRKSHRSKQNPY